MMSDTQFFETHDERCKCHKYIRNRDIKNYGYDWYHERTFLGDEELFTQYVGKTENEVDLMLMLKINGQYVWEHEKIFGKREN